MTRSATSGGGTLTERAAACARTIEGGGVVIAPTETVRALACDASSRAARERMWSIRGTDAAPLAWHVRDAGRVIGVIGALPAAHARIIEKLTPGPVLLAIEFDQRTLDGVRVRVGVDAGVMDDGESLFVRLPSHPGARALLGATERSIVMASIPDDADAIEGRVDGVLDEPPASSGRHSTLIVLERGGGWRVAREGVIEERYIRKMMTRTILFVCTGNTCRSPMAEGIARAVLAEDDGGVETVVRSAGVSAQGGSPAAHEAVIAARGFGADITGHHASALTRELLADADVVYAMTRAHAEMARAVDPSATVLLLDPDGSDIPDPIGSPQQAYDETAAVIERHIRARLKELGA